MIRAFQIVDVPDSRLRTPDQGRLYSAPSTSLRAGFCILYSVLLCFYLSGCAKTEEQPPVWERVKIGDLAPYEGSKTQQAQSLKTMNLDVHIFEIPAESISQLDKIRKRLYIRPLRLKSYSAFTANSFLVRFGQFEIWKETYDLVLAADGQKITRVSLILPDGQAQTIAIAGLDRPQTVYYTSSDDLREGANVGPGVLGLRIKAERIPGLRGVCDVVAYPVFSLGMQSTIPQLDARGKLRQFPFTAAAFGLKMSPGDFVFLAPKEYISDRTALGGLFFSNPQGNLFFSKTKPPEYKPAVRVFLLLCTGMNY